MKLRSVLYTLARLLGDANAAAKGPGPLVKRRLRAAVYRKVNGATAKAMRQAGL